GATHVVVNCREFVDDQAYLLPFVMRHEKYLQEIFTNGEFRVFVIHSRSEAASLLSKYRLLPPSVPVAVNQIVQHAASPNRCLTLARLGGRVPRRDLGAGNPVLSRPRECAIASAIHGTLEAWPKLGIVTSRSVRYRPSTAREMLARYHRQVRNTGGVLAQES